MATPAPMVRDNQAAHRYELLLAGELVGELVYRTGDGVVTLIHTEIVPRFEGRGLGEQLVASALGDVRARGLRVVPLCPFVAAYLRRHPEERDFVESRAGR
jgi:predicted GNAT family acetyltransferase